ncbi:MAG: transglutaminase domain-containing protein [Candidatus Heimdallarchaeota archaeon]
MVSSKYLEPTFFIDSKSEVITKLVEKISESSNQDVDFTKLSFNYVRDKIKYTVERVQHDSPADMKASTTILREKGFCIQKAVALAALLRANNIPARLHFADIINHRSSPHLQEFMGTKVFVFHGYTEVYLVNRWIKLTPAFDATLCEKHNLPVCTFNGVDDAIFPSHDKLGNLFVEYVRDRGVYANLPYKEIFDTFSRYYGSRFELRGDQMDQYAKE